MRIGMLYSTFYYNPKTLEAFQSSESAKWLSPYTTESPSITKSEERVAFYPENDPEALSPMRDLVKKYEIKSTSFEPKNYDLNSITKIGHRGCGEGEYNEVSGKFESIRENTIESFLLAKDNGAQMVEMDIHMTIDKELVVYHNNRIKGKIVAEMTLIEFLDASNSTHENYESTNTTLRNILDALSDDIALYLEIKYDPKYTRHDQKHKYPENYEIDLVKEVVTLTNTYKNKKIVFAAFCPLICALLKRYAPGYKTCFLVGDDSFPEGMSDSEFCLKIIDFINWFDIDGLVTSTSIVSRISVIIDVLRGNKSLLCYGTETNSIEAVEKLRSLGFTGFCTDDLPALKDLNLNK